MASRADGKHPTRAVRGWTGVLESSLHDEPWDRRFAHENLSPWCEDAGGHLAEREAENDSAAVPAARTLECVLHAARERDVALEYPRKLQILTEVAHAVAFLHGQGVAHGRVCSRNILLLGDAGEKVQLAGCAERERTSKEARLGYGGMRYASAYLAPELLAPDDDSGGEAKATPESQAVGDEFSDVYAFAVLCAELLTECVPFEDLHQEHICRLVCEREERPVIPSECLRAPSSPSSNASLAEAEDSKTGPTLLPAAQDLVELINQCWSQQFYGRPDMETVARSLSHMLAAANAAEMRTDETKDQM